VEQNQTFISNKIIMFYLYLFFRILFQLFWDFIITPFHIPLEWFYALWVSDWNQTISSNLALHCNYLFDILNIWSWKIWQQIVEFLQVQVTTTIPSNSAPRYLKFWCTISIYYASKTSRCNFLTLSHLLLRKVTTFVVMRLFKDMYYKNLLLSKLN